MPPRNQIGDVFALRRRVVRKHHAADAIADCPNIFDVCSEISVGQDNSALGAYACLVKRERFGKGASARAYHDKSRLDGVFPLCGVENHSETVGGFFNPCHSRAAVDGHALFFERKREILTHVLVHIEQKSVKILYDENLFAKRRKKLGKFNSDYSAAHYRRGLGDFVASFKKIIAVYAQFASLRFKRGGHAACRDDYVVGSIFFAVGDDGFCVLEARESVDDGDLARFKQLFHSSPELGNHLVAPCVHFVKVVAAKLGVYADRRGFAHRTQRLRAVKKRLGGNTASVETGAAHLSAFKQNSFQTVLRAPDCCGVSGGASAENHNPKMLTHFSVSSNNLIMSRDIAPSGLKSAIKAPSSRLFILTISSASIASLKINSSFTLPASCL